MADAHATAVWSVHVGVFGHAQQRGFGVGVGLDVALGKALAPASGVIGYIRNRGTKTLDTQLSAQPGLLPVRLQCFQH